MKSRVTDYDEELLAKSRTFIAAAEEHPESREVLARYGFSEDERARGRALVSATERSFAWEREGRAWNFLGLTPARRLEEAHHWYHDARNRYVAECLRRAEEDSGWVGFGAAAHWPLSRKLTEGSVIFARHAARVFSLRVYWAHRDDFRRNLALATQTPPADAPPPKDTALVELAGWYERWRLLAHRVFRLRPDLLAPYGLSAGKAPPRLRGKAAQARYGERAGGSLPVLQDASAASDDADDVDDGDDPAEATAPV